MRGGPEKSTPGFPGLLRSRIPVGARHIAVIAAPRQSRLVEQLLDAWPQADVVVVDARETVAQRHPRLVAGAPWEVVVDASGVMRQRVRRVLAAFYLLVPGGVLVVRGLPAGGGEDPLHELLETGATAGVRERDAVSFTRAVTAFDVVGSHVVVTRGAGTALAKLDEDQLDELVALRGDTGIDVLDVVPAVHFESRCRLREQGARHPAPAAYDAPAASLRAYPEVIAAPGQVVSAVAGDCRVLLPDTYRHRRQGRRLRNSFTDEVAPLFATVRHDTEGLERLPGTYFHLDNEMRGHFGHLVTEQVSRLWAWPLAQELHPGIKVLVATNLREKVTPWELRIYQAAGIEPDDIVLIRDPVRVELLVSATPMLSNPAYVHPAIAETWARIGDALAEGAARSSYPARIFCSRRISKRACRNTAEVEELFVAAGFEVVYPEDLDLSDQIAMFRAADVVGGFAGSGLFNLCFVKEPKRVVTIASERYVSRNEYLIASVLGHRIDAVYCIADEPAFQSPYAFDHERDGPFLAEVFATL